LRKDRTRNKVRQAKKGKYWCWGCDQYMIWEGQKCPNCGKREMRSRDKKPAPIGEQDV